MIFQPELVKQIRKGKKTMTRRPVKRGKLGEVKQNYVADRSYAVQPGRGQRETCRITVLETRRERLGDITHDDAKAEGFKTTQEFFDYWQALYGSVDHEQQVWAIRFRLGEPERPLFLAGQTQQSDYTFEKAKAPKGEPEVTDDETTARFVEDARLKAEQDKTLRKKQLSAQDLTDRLAAIRAQAAAQGIDIRRQEASIIQRIEAMERKVRRKAA